MNKRNFMVWSLNLLFLMQNIKKERNFVFQVFFFSQDLVFPRHHLTLEKKQDYHWVASDSWLNL